MTDSKLIDTFQQARKSNELAVIEGVQAVKHALRFNADIRMIVTCDQASAALLAELAPDVSINPKILMEVREAVFNKLSPQPPRTKLIALANRSNYSLSDIDPAKPLVLLEEPRDLENIGAVVRVAAAADAAAVCILSDLDIWHPAILRGAAGLHFAVPVFTISKTDLGALPRPFIALDPTGNENVSMPNAVTYIFGTERHGISPELLKASDSIMRLPMKSGVSSLNLATSVAATLYRR